MQPVGSYSNFTSAKKQINQHFEPNEECVQFAKRFNINEVRTRNTFIIWCRSKNILSNNFHYMYLSFLKREASHASSVLYPDTRLEKSRTDAGIEKKTIDFIETKPILHSDFKHLPVTIHNHPLWSVEAKDINYPLNDKFNIKDKQYSPFLREARIRCLYLLSIEDGNEIHLPSDDFYIRSLLVDELAYSDNKRPKAKYRPTKKILSFVNKKIIEVI